MEYNSTQSKYCLEQSTILTVFKEKLKAYVFTLDDVTFLFWYCAIQEDKDVS